MPRCFCQSANRVSRSSFDETKEEAMQAALAGAREAAAAA
jgi:hypothetical protein